MRRLLLAATLAALLLAPIAHAWSWPADGPVLQPFVFDPAHPFAGGQHRGIDVGADLGATVRAPAAGTVTFAGTVPSSGRSVTITTADGYAVTLTHLGSIAVAKGAAVAEGEGIATIGASGDAEESVPYVHLGVRVAAEAQGYVDPAGLLPARAAGAPPALAPPAEPPAAAPPAGADPGAVPAPEPPDPPAFDTPPPVADPDPAVTVETPAPVETPAAPVPSPAVDAPVAAAASEAAPATALEPTAPATAPGSQAPAAAEPTQRAQPARPAPARSAVATLNGLSPQDVTSPSAAHALRRLRAQARAADTPPRDGGWTPPLAAAPRRRTTASDRGAAGARDQALASPSAPVRRAAPVDSAAADVAHADLVVHAAPTDAVRRAPASHRTLVLAALLAAVAAAGALGAVRMMVRCATDAEEEGAGRAGLAVCGGPPSPRPRGGVRRPVGRVRPLSPAARQRRPHGERDGRARHAGDGRRRSGEQALR